MFEVLGFEGRFFRPWVEGFGGLGLVEERNLSQHKKEPMVLCSV